MDLWRNIFDPNETALSDFGFPPNDQQKFSLRETTCSADCEKKADRAYDDTNSNSTSQPPTLDPNNAWLPGNLHHNRIYGHTDFFHDNVDLSINETHLAGCVGSLQFAPNKSQLKRRHYSKEHWERMRKEIVKLYLKNGINSMKEDMHSLYGFEQS